MPTASRGSGRRIAAPSFWDWALGLEAGTDQLAAVEDLIAFYAPQHPDHPMTEVLKESRRASAAPRRRGGRRGRTPM